MTWFWAGFITLVIVLLALDLGVLNRKAHKPSLREALSWTAGWITLGVLFSGVVYTIYERKLYTSSPDSGTIAYSGLDAALTYLTGFVLEESLSIDNLFVMVLIFKNFRIPTAYQHRVLFWGILGAIVMRAGMILGGVWLVTNFRWIMYVFGAYLIWQGVAQLRHKDEGDAPPGALERIITRVLPIRREDVPEGKFLVRVDGRLAGTTLLLALINIETADVVFALDSVPAVLTVTTDPFIVFTSNIFAILGLRSLYFVIADMMDRFEHLRYALAFILVFVGVKMTIHDFLHIPIAASLGTIVAAVVIGIFSSMRSTPKSAISEQKNSA
jgi:tellurite resistance protein TerC